MEEEVGGENAYARRTVFIDMHPVTDTFLGMACFLSLAGDLHTTYVIYNIENQNEKECRRIDNVVTELDRCGARVGLLALEQAGPVSDPAVKARIEEELHKELPLPAMNKVPAAVRNNWDKKAALIKVKRHNSIDTALSPTQGLVFKPGVSMWTESVVVKTYKDHRMAMAFSLLAAALPRGIRIQNPGCVDKTYPQFWAHFRKLQLRKRTLDLDAVNLNNREYMMYA